MSHLYRGTSIDASYQVWVHWPSGYSEDELDSPRKIIQQPPSENMDVDANDGKYIVISFSHFDILL
jgi:hypothetical protein